MSTSELRVHFFTMLSVLWGIAGLLHENAFFSVGSYVISSAYIVATLWALWRTGKEQVTP